MAVISTDTFDPLRRYVSVRMQQGVALVDADWNEREDARRFAVRSFLHWFAADGVPFGNDGFRIDGTGVANDFTIRAGTAVAPPDPLADAGRTLAGGGEALITADIAFRQQDLHVAKGATATALAAKLRVPAIAELPPGPGTVLVYLDVWERFVSPAEDGSLVLPGLGTESCARLKREWAVRALAGTALPGAGHADFRPGHAYFELARIERAAGVPGVAAADVTDRRERRLRVPPATLLLDAFGTTGATAASVITAYRRGANRPPVSFREALNALMLGHLPGSPDVELQVAAGTEMVGRPIADGAGSLVAPLLSTRGNPGGAPDVYLVRASLANAEAGFEQPIQATSGLNLSGTPQLVPLGGGDLLFLYGVDASRVAFRRGPYPAIATAAEEPPVATGDFAQPMVAISGSTAIVVFYDNTAGQWVSRRLNLTTGWIDPAPVTFLASAVASPGTAVPVVDPAGNAWFAVIVAGGIQARGMTPGGGVVTTSPLLSGSGANDVEHPAVVRDPNGDIWVLYGENNVGLWYATFRGGAWSTGFVTGSQPDDGFPQAVADPTGGGFWMTWQRMVGTRAATFLRWYNARDRSWGPPRALTTTTKPDGFPSPYLEPNGALWVVWSRVLSGAVFRAYVKRVYTRV